MATTRKAATTAENRPVYGYPIHVKKYMIADRRTYKNEKPISILLPTLDYFVFLFLCGLGVYGEKGP